MPPATVLTQEQWHDIFDECNSTSHPSGWSYKREVKKLINTLDARHMELVQLRNDFLELRSDLLTIRTALSRLNALAIREV